MVDTGDSKSPVFTDVRVQVPPWAPIKQLNQIVSQNKEKFDYKKDYFYFEIIIKRDKKSQKIANNIICYFLFLIKIFYKILNKYFIC